MPNIETLVSTRKLYKLDEPDTQGTAGEARTSSSVMYSYGPPHMAKQKQDDQLEHTYSSYVRIRDVTLKTFQKRWMIGRSGERGSGMSVLAARHDDDDNINSIWKIALKISVFENIRFCLVILSLSYRQIVNIIKVTKRIVFDFKILIEIVTDNAKGFNTLNFSTAVSRSDHLTIPAG